MNIADIYLKFPTKESCIIYLEQARWHGKPICQYCKSDNTTPLPKEQRHHCNGCNTAFSVTAGTIFKRTHLPLQKWFLAISLILNSRENITARQLASDLEVNKNTAWFLSMRIRNAITEPDQRAILELVLATTTAN